MKDCLHTLSITKQRKPQGSRQGAALVITTDLFTLPTRQLIQSHHSKVHSLPLSLTQTQTHREIYTRTLNRRRINSVQKRANIFMHIKHQTRGPLSFCISPTHSTCTGVAKHHRVKWQTPHLSLHQESEFLPREKGNMIELHDG